MIYALLGDKILLTKSCLCKKRERQISCMEYSHSFLKHTFVGGCNLKVNVEWKQFFSRVSLLNKLVLWWIEPFQGHRQPSPVVLQYFYNTYNVFTISLQCGVKRSTVKSRFKATSTPPPPPLFCLLVKRNYTQDPIFPCAANFPFNFCKFKN